MAGQSFAGNLGEDAAGEFQTQRLGLLQHAQQLGTNLVNARLRAVVHRDAQLFSAHAKPNAIAEHSPRKVGPAKVLILPAQAAAVAARIERDDFDLEQIRNAEQTRGIQAGRLIQNLAGLTRLEQPPLAQ